MENLSIQIKDVLEIDWGNSKCERSHLFYSLSFVLDGNGEIKQNGVKVKYEPKDVIFCPPKCSYTKKSNQEKTITVFFETSENFDKIKVFSSRRDLTDYFTKLLKITQNKDEGYYYKSAVIFNAILGFFQADEFSFGEESSADKIKNLIDLQFCDPDFCINEIAVKFNFSEVYARRIFKDKFATSPKEYLQKKRIEYACFLLSLNCFSVREIALKSGFRDDKYFSFAFKKEKGVSPSEYK